ncbi:flagellinolysin [Psychrosphaera ytuae]|uniref:Flagellin n=1 Tax=Psychrosphaera ytuae TaxID=2820710 RepID=A0A975DAZ2_9GAMM|nr:flagellinolysin [Psychrosphaera ytuae]QTH63812.1 flagellinolysin [Psychrosphaera ytuae]
MRVATNVSAIFQQRQLRKTEEGVAVSMERLSSGLRINNAGDDAAGLQISTRLTSQVNGMNVAIRNANDGISMNQVAEGALQQVTNNLFRMKDLALQAANGTYSKEDRKAVDEEFQALKAEIDRINDTTRFGDTKLFYENTGSLIDTVERDIVNGVQKTWFTESEAVIAERFGLLGRGSLKLDLEYVDGKSGTLAYVAAPAAAGPQYEQVMVIDMGDFQSSEDIFTDGALAGTVLHEMVHAVMNANMDMLNLKSWFKEGAAEVIRGADSELAQAIASAGSEAALLADFVGVNGLTSLPASPTNSQIRGVYQGGYVALRIIEDEIGETGIQDFMAALSDGETLDDAFNIASNGIWTNEAAFMTDIQAIEADGDAKFVNFIQDKMNLTNLDNGALGGRDAAGGDIREQTLIGAGAGRSNFNNYVVLKDGRNSTTDFDPVTNYYNPPGGEVRLEDYQTEINGAGGQAFTLQVGANSQELISFTMGSFTASSLGLAYSNVTDEPQFAAIAVDDALRIVDKQRAQLGATMNRLEKSINSLENQVENISASRARIRDADFAIETADLTKGQILRQASTTLLSQANQIPELALQLLA